MIFEYPVPRETRRHGPFGYETYESYRPWLRDEFDFRCIYCLKRESWGQVTGDFDLDHFVPQSIDSRSRLDYFNLVYACHRCNLVKLNQLIANPIIWLSADHIHVHPDGELAARNLESRRLILQLDLNAPQLLKWRVMWMRIIELAKERDPSLYQSLTGPPSDLPDLSRLRPPGNSRPEGLIESWFALRQQRHG